MITLIFVLVLLLVFPLFFPGYYITELLVSFLPYLAAISAVFVIISFVHLRKKIKPDYPIPVHRYFRGASFFVFCFLFFWYSKQFNTFYIPKIDSTTGKQFNISNSSTGDLKILFANIHKNNIQYDEIKKTISNADPDIIMFVEFADHHYSHLKEFLQKQYPYINNVSRSKKFIGNVVFSKYPLSNKANDFPQGMRRYGYFSIFYQNQEIYFYLVHTSSPNSYNHYIMRNDQIVTLVKDFKNHENIQKHDNIVVIGDFNITPWSSYYETLSSAFSGELLNVDKRIPFLFTRRLNILPLFFAHIDHLWASFGLNVPQFNALTMPGSDHKAFLFTLSIKK
ncbi:MAG: endonuclease/exonuclease/phosphatase family protein [candidate division SR1 bacterium]|nr:endonuclease/exonuclease/phosphatase family protein [candidate division SR1 bacterium]